MGTSHTVPLIFEKSALPCIFAIFLNKTLSDIKFFSKSFKYLNSLGIGSSASLLQTAWQGIALFERCLQYVWQVILFVGETFQHFSKIRFCGIFPFDALLLLEDFYCISFFTFYFLLEFSSYFFLHISFWLQHFSYNFCKSPFSLLALFWFSFCYKHTIFPIVLHY